MILKLRPKVKKLVQKTRQEKKVIWLKHYKLEREVEDKVGVREEVYLTGSCKPCRGVYSLC